MSASGSPTRTGWDAVPRTVSGPPTHHGGWDVTANPRIARLVADRRFQFLLILPNQIIFWTVIFVGLMGTALPGLNSAVLYGLIHAAD